MGLTEIKCADLKCIYRYIWLRSNIFNSLLRIDFLPDVLQFNINCQKLEMQVTFINTYLHLVLSPNRLLVSNKTLCR